MKKRLFAIVISAILLVSLAMPLSGYAVEIPNGDAGGFDFYSMTVHYDQPTVLEYKQVTASQSKKDKMITSYSSTGRISYTAGWVFDEPTDKYEIRTGDKLGKAGTAYVFYQSQVPTSSGNRGNFMAMTYGDHVSDLYYSTFPAQYAYVHNIHDGDIILSVDPISIRGAAEIVDDALNPNPNIEFHEDGYAKDVSGGRIDFNGYLLDENNNWYTVDASGKVENCSLFKETSAGNLVPVSRFDTNGKVLKVSKYDRALIYVVDENGEIAKDSNGNLRNATPVQGVPVMKTKISKITVEIDALGEKLYSDVASDPQQKNTVTVSLGNSVDNINKFPAAGTIVGTAKCITTRDKAPFSKRVEATVQSVELEVTEDVLNNLSPIAAKLFIQFGVQETQGIDAYNKRFIMANDAAAEKGFKTQELKILTDADADKFQTSESTGSGETSDQTAEEESSGLFGGIKDTINNLINKIKGLI